jgi:hypothetical protein
MKYMLLVYLDEQALSESERQQCYVKSAQLAQEIHNKGQYLDASPLHPTSVRLPRPENSSAVITLLTQRM